jgi:glutamate-1-semialdehyde 2,1-aminomutase
MTLAESSRSEALFERAKQVTVGGVTAAGRFNPVLGRPYYFDHGDGCRLWDVDGHEYIDFSSSNGASMLGFNHPAINEAVAKSLGMGTMCTQETEYHVDLAERISELLPGAERVRFTNTGTEATMAAIRIARAATGRDKVLKFEGHFHGMHDYVLFNSHTAPDRPYEAIVPSFPDSAGIPPAVGKLLVNVPFNDERALVEALDRYQDELACVILEPVSYNLGCIPAEISWLRRLRAETKRRGIVLIFDEVLSGFRMALGGAAEYFEVTPDLATWGKALGAGWPIAAVTGQSDVMSVLAPVGRTMVSGTYTTHLSAVLASLAALDVMSAPGFYAHLNAVAEHLYAGLGELFARSELPGHVQGLGARFGIYFGFAEKATDYRSATRFDHDLNNRFLEGCRQAGLHFHDFGAKNAPMHYGTTAAHETSDIDEALARLEPLFMKLGRLRAAALGESG